MSKWLETRREVQQLETEVMQDKQLKSAKEAMLFSVVKNAINGDLKALEFIQSTIGEKPIYNSF